MIPKLPDKDLLYMPTVISSVQIRVHDMVYELIGEISSSSEDKSEASSSDELEKYLLTDPVNSDSQMAHTKQTARKQQCPGTSAGGLLIAHRSPRCSPQFLDSDFSLDTAAQFYYVDTLGSGMSLKGSPRKGPASGGGGMATRSKSTRIQTEDPQLEPPQNPPQSTEPTGDPDQENQENVENKEAENEEEGDASVPARRPKAKLPMSQLCPEWNRTAHIGYTSETTRGWLKKMKDLRMYQGHAL